MLLYVGRRLKPITDKDAEVDTVFWGSDQHRTWEESESDSEVSYNLDDADSSDSSSDMDDDESGAGSDSDESESGDEDDGRKPKKVFRGGYKDPRSKPAAPKRKLAPVQRAIKKEIVPETPSSAGERRQTRDTTRAMTEEITQRESTKKPLVSKEKPKTEKHVLTQEELLEEARLTEEWNTADYEAYIRYTELSERERMQFLQKRKPKEQVNCYKVVHRSFMEGGELKSEIKVFPPMAGTLRPLNDVLLGIGENEFANATRSPFRYRHPRTGEGYNTCGEFRQIQERLLREERMQAERVLEILESK